MSHTPRDPMVGSGREQEGGKLATSKQDFHSHHSGGGFRHSANDVDMHPELTGGLGVFQDSTLQGTLEKMADFMNCIGQGFITIGDGYGSSCGNEITIGDPGIPDLEAAFTAAFAYDRLRNGGIIMVKAGDYVLSSTVTVPAGISIMGEIGGTTIVGETSELPMFKISRSANRPFIDKDSSVESRDPIDRCVFFNLTLADNLNGNVSSGGPSMTTTPMIVCERGSDLTCEQVTFLGRMGALGAGPSYGRTKTLSAIGFIAGVDKQTVLKTERCIADGLRNFISFTPGGNADKLLVDKCKVRVFGSENTADKLDRAVNSFITSAGSGYVKITNNHFISDAATSQVSSLLTITSGSPNVIFVGNYGNLIFTTTDIGNDVVDSLLVNNAGTTIHSIMSGNDFDNKHINNEWFLTVGDGVKSIGDITGPNALDKVSSFYSTDKMFHTIYVKRGAYTVTTDGFPYNIVGESSVITGDSPTNIDWPTITLNCPTTHATLGNKYFSTGKSVKNITFKASGTYHTVISAGGINFSNVFENCQFEDTCLMFTPITAGYVEDGSGEDEKASINISNCSFVQTGTFSDNLSLLVPIVHNTVIERCFFSGNGYGIAAGNFPGKSYSSTFSTTNVPRNFVMRDVIADLSQGSITGDSPLGSVNNRFITIQDNEAKVNIDNCTIVTDIEMDAKTTFVDTSLKFTFTRFIDVLAKEINIDNSTVNGPHQIFEASSIEYAMPAVRLTATESIYVDKSRFVGALPMQITGDPDLLLSEFALRGIGIFNSQFRSGDGAETITLTTLDIDYDPQNLWTAYSQIPKIDVVNNVFDQRLGSVTVSSNPVLHENNDPNQTSYYIGQGIVQIYAGLTDINFSENKVFGRLRPFGLVDGSDPINKYTGFTGVYIDGYSMDKFSGSTGLVGNVVHVHNNTIKAMNYYDTPTSTDLAAALAVVANNSKITNNYLTLVNYGTKNRWPGGLADPQNVACALSLYNAPYTGTNVADAIVTGNTFSRKDDFGISYPHKVCTVLVLGGSGPGICVDNSFSDTDVDGYVFTASLQFLGPTPPLGGTGPWTFERNRNQIVWDEIRSMSGSFVMNTPGGADDYDVIMANDTATGNRVRSFPGTEWPGADSNYHYKKGSGRTTFNWYVPLHALLPTNVEVYGISIFSVSNELFGAAPVPAKATATLSLDQDSTIGVSDSANMYLEAEGFALAPVVPRYTFYTTPNLNIYALFTFDVDAAGTGDYDNRFTSLVVSYKY